MSELKNRFKQGVVFWFAVFLTISISWLVYAALWSSWVSPESLEKNSWEQLKSEDWKSILTDLKLLKETVDGLSLEKHPIWSILMTTNWANPSSYLWYWTWEAWWNWKVPVWVDTTDEDFNDSEKIWWEKEHTLSINEMPSHNHWGQLIVSSWYWSWLPATINEVYFIWWVWYAWWSQAHNNLQPYITVYMWKRTN